MTHHPHVHMIVPGGGIAPDGSRWISKRPRFFLPVRVLSKLFGRLMIEKLVAAHAAGRLTFHGAHAALVDAKPFAAYLAPLKKRRWYVYTKRPLAGPKAVLAYLSRYTHRVAISNRRLIAADAKTVTFKVKDYRINGPGRYKMTLDTHEFIRRFLIHLLPNGFHRIRHYGLLASGVKADSRMLARKLLDLAPPAPEPEGSAAEPPAALKPCPCCGSAMRIIEVFEAGEPCPTQAGRNARRHQHRHLMSPGDPFCRCCADLSRWPRAGRDSARPSQHPARPRSASDPCCQATRASPPPPLGSKITPPATSSAPASATPVPKSP